MDTHEADVCPKCGQPRLAGSLDCPYCGIVYSRWRGAAGTSPPAGAAEAAGIAEAAGTGEAGESAAASSDPGQLYEGPLPGDLYAGEDPAAGRAAAGDPAPGAVASLYTPQPQEPAGGRVRDTFLGRNLGFSLLAVGVVYLLLQGVWISVMFGGSTNLDNARTQFRRLSGFEVPRECDDAAIFTFAGRRFVVLAESDEPEEQLAMTVLLFHPGGLGDEVPAEVLLARVRGRLEAVGLPFRQMRSRNVVVEGSPATAVTYALGPEGHERARVFVLAFRARDGKQALLVLAGPSTRVALVSRRWLLG